MVVHRSKGVLPVSVFRTVEGFERQVYPLAGPTLFATSEDFSFGQTQAIASMAQQHAAHSAVANAPGQRKMRPPTPLSELQNLSADALCQPLLLLLDGQSTLAKSQTESAKVAARFAQYE